MTSITFGRPDSWEHFANSHPLFFERFPHLKTAEEMAFIREPALSTRADKVVFFIGRLCIELGFGHFPRNQIAGKWQLDESFIAGA